MKTEFHVKPLVLTDTKIRTKDRAPFKFAVVYTIHDNEKFIEALFTNISDARKWIYAQDLYIQKHYEVMKLSEDI